MEQRGWYASGKDRRAGRLLRYALFVLVGVAFLLGALLTWIQTAGDVLQALLWGVICAAAAGAIGAIFWAAYYFLVIRKQG